MWVPSIAPMVSGKPLTQEKPCIIVCILFPVGHVIYLGDNSHNAWATRRTALIAVALPTLNRWIIDLKNKYCLY